MAKSLENVLSVRAYQCLIRHNIRTTDDLLSSSNEEIKNFRNIGDRAYNEVIILKEKIREQIV